MNYLAIEWSNFEKIFLGLVILVNFSLVKNLETLEVKTFDHE